MTGHIPGPITSHSIYIQLQRAEQMLSQGYEGKLQALIIYGPPGIGKTTLGENVAKRYHQRWRPERPGTTIGLLRCWKSTRMVASYN
jgi:stage III sporulation protein SpoIIIAA